MKQFLYTQIAYIIFVEKFKFWPFKTKIFVSLNTSEISFIAFTLSWFQHSKCEEKKSLWLMEKVSLNLILRKYSQKNPQPKVTGSTLPSPPQFTMHQSIQQATHSSIHHSWINLMLACKRSETNNITSFIHACVHLCINSFNHLYTHPNLLNHYP